MTSQAKTVMESEPPQTGEFAGEKGREVAMKILAREMTLQEAIGFTDEYLEALYTISKSFYDRGDYRSAETLFTELVSLQSEEAKFWLGLAGSRQQLGEFEMASAAYVEVLSLDPERADAALHASECQMMIGATEAALSGLELTLLIASRNPGLERIGAQAKHLRAILQAQEREPQDESKKEN